MKDLTGQIFEGKNGIFKVLERIQNGKYVNYKIFFEGTNYETIVNSRYIKHGSEIANKMTKSVCEIGIVGKKIKTELEKKLYNTWRQMIKRCYLKNYAPSHKKEEITVSENWRTFTCFEKEVKELENWNKEDFLKGILVFDKDIKKRKTNEISRKYSKENCIWTTKKENQSCSKVSIKVSAFNVITKEKIITNSLREMSKQIKINEKTIKKYLNKEYREWIFEEILMKR